MDAKETGSPRFEAQLRKIVSRYRDCLGGLEGRVLNVIELRAGVRAEPFSRIQVARRLKINLEDAARLERQALRGILNASRRGCAGGGATTLAQEGTATGAAANGGSAGAGAAGTGTGTGATGGAGANGTGSQGTEGEVAGASTEGGTSTRETGASPSDAALVRRILTVDGSMSTAVATPLMIIVLVGLAGGYVLVRARRRSTAADG